MKKRITLLLAMSALVTSGFASVALAEEPAHGNIAIEQPWSRATPPGTPMGVGYLVVRNQGEKAVTLRGANSPRAGQVSVHETRMDDGVMSMQPLKDGLEIPAGEAVELKPNSYHLMLEALPEPLKAGESIPLTLKFDQADPVQVELHVQSLDSGKDEQGMDHSGHKMDH